MWVPDTRRPGFAEECHRQSRLAAQADRADTDLMEFLDDALDDLDE
ncbi:antitoxin MazE-like protein [Acidithiobacillus ferrivorans]